MGGCTGCLSGAQPPMGWLYRGTKKGAAQAAPFLSHLCRNAYQKNCRRASRMFGSSLTKVRAVELYFLLSTIT